MPLQAYVFFDPNFILNSFKIGDQIIPFPEPKRNPAQIFKSFKNCPVNILFYSKDCLLHLSR